jgi:hypothetical protein
MSTIFSEMSGFIEKYKSLFRTVMQCCLNHNSHDKESVDRNVSGGVQKYNFCTPGQLKNRIRGKLSDLLITEKFPAFPA